MAKVKTIYVCQECGTTSPKWMGKCTSCGAWNTLVEEIVTTNTTKNISAIPLHKSNAILLKDISASEQARIFTSDSEFNRVLGGGVVIGSLILIGGEPGIGKSTLLLQIAMQTVGLTVLYISGEESEQQIKMRAERLNEQMADVYLYTETKVDLILHQAQHLKPDLMIIDSIQTLQVEGLESAAGTVSQVREATHALQNFAKSTGTATVIVSHITKEGVIAGPKLLEHMVDTVLQFEGDRHYNYRMLRTTKNRFGSTSELGIYEMRGDGLRPVSNPSELLITMRDEPASGVAIAVTMEGNRAMMIEVQALVSNAVYGTPQRSATGYDLRRLHMILAVLDKKCGFRFGTKDVFLNIAGGMKVDDPATDLAVVAALLSSYEDIPLKENICFSGEIGLSGEIRAVNKIEQRVSEAEKIGYQNIFISKFNTKGLKKSAKLNITGISKVENLVQKLF
ncbi:MAG: DNA repair protein RadA [Chitinophagales bacterium]|nr:DNA repair protein RadA [Chitinophagales bacterium]